MKIMNKQEAAEAISTMITHAIKAGAEWTADELVAELVQIRLALYDLSNECAPKEVYSQITKSICDHVRPHMGEGEPQEAA